MLKKLHMSIKFSNLVVAKLLSYKVTVMYNFVAKFGKILEICKQFAGNQVNEKGNVTRCGVVPTFSDLEVVALSITAEAFSIDSENYLFNRLNTECPGAIPNLITRRQYNQRRKKTMLLGENIRQAIAKAIDGGETVFSIDSKPVKVCQNARANRCQMGRTDIDHAPSWGYCASQNMYYYGYKLHALCGISGVIHSYDMTAANVHDLQYLKDVQWEYSDCTILGDKGYLSAPVQLDLFETANITLDVPYRLNQKNWTPPTWAYKRFRKRIETVFSQLNDHLMMIRNYAKQPAGLFARMAAKVAALDIVRAFCEINQIEWYWFRLFPLFGPHESDQWLIPSLIKNIFTQESMDFTPGEQKLPYLYVGECAKAIKAAITADGHSGVYNICSDNPLALKELVARIRDKVRPDFKLNFGAFPYRYGQSMYMEGDTTALRRNIYNIVTSDFEQRLSETIDYYIRKYSNNPSE